MTEWIFTSSALILVVIALRGLLKQRLRPLVRYALWALVLVRLLIPFSLFQSDISLGNVTQDIGKEAGAAVTQYEAKYDQVVRQYEQMGVTVPPAQARDEARQQVYADTYQSISDRYNQAGITVPDTQIRQEAEQQTDTISMLALLTDALPVIWYAGMVLMALALLGSNAWFAWKLRREITPISEPGFPLPVYETHYAATPCLFGLVRPGVYLTAEAATDSVMRRHVLAHELTHFRHGDHIWSVLRGVCLVAHWYNPLVWAAALLSRQDAELACDEATIRALGEAERTAYGKTLIGMTCIRHDPRCFLVTATTMIGGKRTLKERVVSIARKPKNALYAVIACVLVLAIAAGCAFTGPVETNPTEPPSPEDEVYNKLKAVVQEINSRDAYHFKLYLTPYHPAEVDPTTREDFTQGWISGADMYVEQAHQGPVTPMLVYYNGDTYAHISDNLWLPSTDNTTNTDTYRITLPSRSDYTMTWSETEDFLDINFVAKDRLDHGVFFRLDPDGELVWYAPCQILDSATNAETGMTLITQMYSVMFYPDMDADSIREHLDTVVPPLIANMEIQVPDTEPTTEPTETGPITSVETIPLPEGYTLSDVVTTRSETISWTDNGADKTIQYHIPVITPFSEDAILLQNMIDALLVSIYEEELSYSRDERYEPHQFGSTFEASLNDGVLSLLIQTPTDYGVSIYAYNLDTVSGNILTTTDMVTRFLPDTSYPQFLSAVVRMQEVLFRQTHDSSVYYLSSLPSENTYVLNDTWLYLDGNGDLCILFHAYHLGGGESDEQTIPLNSGDIVWEPPSQADAYGWLFNIDADQAHMEAAYASLLFQAFYANPEEFLHYFALGDMEALSSTMGKYIQGYNPEAFADILKDLRENGDLSIGGHSCLDHLFAVLP